MMVITIISLGLLVALYKAFTIDLAFSKRQKIILLLALLGGVLFLMAASAPKVIGTALVGEGPIWFGVFALAFTLYIICALVSFLFSRYRQQIVFGTFIVLILTSVYSIFNALHVPTVREIQIPMARLPEKLQGFTIVHITDLHLGGVATPQWLEQTVKKINALHPHLVVITGDLIEESHWNESCNVFVEILKKLESTYGVFAVTGNHDLYNGGKHFKQITGDAGITMLNNRIITVAGGIQLAGICDPVGRRYYQEEGPDLNKALKNIEPGLPVVLLSHNPVYFRAAKEYGIDLQLSGHTHAGQIPPVDLLVSLLYRHPYGLYKEGASYFYTSCGTSVMGLPMRLFSRNEIVKIILATEDTESTEDIHKSQKRR